MPEYELDFGPYFWPRWVRYPVATMFRQVGDDGLTRWERKRLGEKYRKEMAKPPSPEARKRYREILESRRMEAN